MHQIYPVAVVLTSGDESHHQNRRYRVPKRDLIAALSVGFEQQTIKIAAGLALSDVLLGELQDFRMQTRASTGRSTYDARSGSHDDLLIAVALAIWWHTSGPSPPVLVRYIV